MGEERTTREVSVDPGEGCSVGMKSDAEVSECGGREVEGLADEKGVLSEERVVCREAMLGGGGGWGGGGTAVDAFRKTGKGYIHHVH